MCWAVWHLSVGARGWCVCRLSGHYLWTFPWFLQTNACCDSGTLHNMRQIMYNSPIISILSSVAICTSHWSRKTKKTPKLYELWSKPDYVYLWLETNKCCDKTDIRVHKISLKIITSCLSSFLVDCFENAQTHTISCIEQYSSVSLQKTKLSWMASTDC